MNKLYEDAIKLSDDELLKKFTRSEIAQMVRIAIYQEAQIAQLNGILKSNIPISEKMRTDLERLKRIAEASQNIELRSEQDGSH